MEFGTIAEEAALCRAAFKDSKVGDWTWLCHHDTICEPLIELAENRIWCILTFKPEYEQAIRLREFRPIADISVISDDLRQSWTIYSQATEVLRRVEREFHRAGRAYFNAYMEWSQSCIAYHKTYTLHAPELTVIHKALFPDTRWDGSRLNFVRKNANEIH